ncbi:MULTISPECIES: discoidin domain-containing protein [Bacteroides]|uniref:discoidin domain-containing protein n=1 Tax=Bacteroidales TaxID=171549 RepID=UPI002161C386|nr:MULTISPECIES: discoidin domain-containing protein [Bacteroides]UVP26550.1 discoidin domain-containing protein [Bacteroides xylanisolvens]
MTGIGIEHRYSGANAQKATILTPLDNENWVTQGTGKAPNVKTIYFQFYAPQTVRYVKFELLRSTGSLYVSEAYIYNNAQ